MQVKAIYEDGAINFAQPLRFKHRKFEVVVNIPEAELDNLPVSPSVSTRDRIKDDSKHDSADLLLTKIKQILGPYYRQHPAASVEQDKATYLEALEEKYSR